MTFLELCNSLISKAGISGSLTSVTGQTGEAGRVVNWINEAYLNIQLADPSWNWLRSTLSFTTTSGQYEYTLAQTGATDMGLWKMDSFRRYITTTGTPSEQILTPISYQNFRDTYLFGAMRTAYGDPRYITEGPNRSLNLGMIPGPVGYTVVGEYWKAPVSMSASTDTPLMPAQFQMIIVYRAMMMYGMYEAASEVVQEGTALYNTMLRRLMRDQADDFSTGGALA